MEYTRAARRDKIMSLLIQTVCHADTTAIVSSTPIIVIEQFSQRVRQITRVVQNGTAPSEDIKQDAGYSTGHAAILLKENDAYKINRQYVSESALQVDLR